MQRLAAPNPNQTDSCNRVDDAADERADSAGYAVGGRRGGRRRGRWAAHAVMVMTGARRGGCR